MGLIYKDGIPYGGGGHSIINSENETLPQRNRVQINGANIVDDPQHDKTILNIENVDISGKADKVTSATNGNFAGLDSNGNLTDSGIPSVTTLTSTDPYTYRQGKGNLADIEIEGASVGWNQLVANSGTVSVTVPSGHKYLSKISGSWSISQSSGTAISSLVGGTDMIIDLTQAFNPTVADAIYAMEQATAGAGVAFFRKYFPKDYYAYDVGSIQSVCVGSRKVAPQNYYNREDVMNAYLDADNGTITSSSANSYSIFCYLPKAGIYTVQKALSSVFRYALYNNKPIPYTQCISGSFVKLSPDSTTSTFMVDHACWFAMFCVNTSSSDDVARMDEILDSVRVVFGLSTAENEYPFDSTKQLRGMFSLVNGELKANGDIYTADGNIQRKYGIVDLGTLTWTKNSDNMFSTSRTSYGGKAQGLGVCAKYVYGGVSSTGMPDKQFSIGNNNLIINDTAYSDAATFKTAMSGVYLVYELATPTTESAQPYQNPQRAYIDGTEEFTDGLTRDVMIPVGNNTTYQQDKILPSVEDYVDAVAEQKSDISAIGTNEDKATASQAYTVGQHFYKDGKFCTVIANIASGGTFTLNTNYVEGTIAQAIEAINVSSGHTIVNSSGSSMTTRSKLKFANATVTDDPTNDQTVITTNPASAVQTATLNDVNFIKDSQDSGVYYITRSGFCEVHIKTIVAKNAGQGLLVATGLPRSAYKGIIMGNTPYFEDGTAFYINTTNNITSLYALIPDTGVKSGYVLYMMN